MSSYQPSQPSTTTCGICRLSKTHNVYCSRCINFEIQQQKIESVLVQEDIYALNTNINLLNQSSRKWVLDHINNNNNTSINFISTQKSISSIKQQDHDLIENFSSDPNKINSLYKSKFQLSQKEYLLYLINYQKSNLAALKWKNSQITQSLSTVQSKNLQLIDEISTLKLQVQTIKTRIENETESQTISNQKLLESVQQETNQQNNDNDLQTIIYKEMIRNCKNLINLFDIKRRRKKAYGIRHHNNNSTNLSLNIRSSPVPPLNSIETYMSFSVIPNFLDLSQYSPSVINTATERMAYFCQYLAYYLNIPLPYNILLPQADNPHVRIGVANDSKSSPLKPPKPHKSHTSSSSSSSSSSVVNSLSLSSPLSSSLKNRRHASKSTTDSYLNIKHKPSSNLSTKHHHHHHKNTNGGLKTDLKSNPLKNVVAFDSEFLDYSKPALKHDDENDNDDLSKKKKPHDYSWYSYSYGDEDGGGNNDISDDYTDEEEGYDSSDSDDSTQTETNNKDNSNNQSRSNSRLGSITTTTTTNNNNNLTNNNNNIDKTNSSSSRKSPNALIQAKKNKSKRHTKQVLMKRMYKKLYRSYRIPIKSVEVEQAHNQIMQQKLAIKTQLNDLLITNDKIRDFESYSNALAMLFLNFSYIGARLGINKLLKFGVFNNNDDDDNNTILHEKDEKGTSIVQDLTEEEIISEIIQVDRLFVSIQKLFCTLPSSSILKVLEDNDPRKNYNEINNEKNNKNKNNKQIQYEWPNVITVRDIIVANNLSQVYGSSTEWNLIDNTDFEIDHQ